MFPALDALISVGKSNKEDGAARNKSQAARRDTSNGDLFPGNALDSRAYDRVAPVIAVKLGPSPFDVSLDYGAAFPSPPRPLDTIACAPPGKNNAV